MKRLLGACLALMSVLLASPATAAEFPDRPIRLVMPFSPGGPTDMVARVLAQHAAERLGQPIVVENRAGANGIIGTGAVASAPPDGYMLLLAPTSHTINPSLYKDLPYDTVRDFASVIYVGNSPGLVLVVGNQVPAKSVQEFIELAKKPGTSIAYGSAGNGNLLHLAGEYFNDATGSRMLHVPYKGAGAIIAGLYSGEIQAAFLGPPQAAELIKGGKLRGLAVTSPKRMPQLPDLPTIAESGYPGYDFDGGIQAAIYAPAGTPPATIAKLNEAFNAVLQEPEIRERFATLALDIGGGPPSVLDKQVANRMKLYSGLLNQAGIKPE
ncbi:MAG TPA: tripartite tricarboxylate transporter substrate binding protein [Bordetella sp.]|nr:tripartite tricarboxylate transporter substrate binding protein [Bordetella sp.]